MIGGPGWLEDIAEKIVQVKQYPHDLRKLFLGPIERELREKFAGEWAEAEAMREADRRARLRERAEDGRKFWMAALPGGDGERRGVIDRWERGAATREDRRAMWGVVMKDVNASRSADRELNMRAAHGRVLEFKSAGGDDEFTGYASTFGSLDRTGEVMQRGSFRRTIPEFLAAGWIALNHQIDRPPVAYPVAAAEDDKGLLLSGRFHSTDEAQACRTVVRERLAAGKSVGLSIGFLTAEGGSRLESRGGRTVKVITDVDLFEVSICNIPADPNALLIPA